MIIGERIPDGTTALLDDLDHALYMEQPEKVAQCIEPITSLHTRTLVRPPNNPDGASASAAITAVNVTIWVLLDPSQVVAQASTRP